MSRLNMGKISKIIEAKHQKEQSKVERLFEKKAPFSKTDLKPVIVMDTNSNKIIDAKWPKIKSLAKEILYNSIAQASMKTFETPIIVLKIFLLLCVLTSTGFSAYFVIELFLNYFSYEVTTTTRTLSETPAPFPKVTLCNYNQFTTVESIEFLRMINQISRPDIDMFNQTQLNGLNYAEKIELFSSIYSAATSYTLSQNLSDFKKQKLGHRLEDILISCSFNGDECTSDDFVWVYDRW
jgi:hypothetical protein